MKILMIGLGSIGQRHLRNLKRLYGDTIDIIAYRTRRLQQTFSDDLKIRENVNLEEEYNLQVFSSLDEALAQKPDIAFITNITAKHMECAIACAQAGCHLLIEKPLSCSMEGVNELMNIVQEKGNCIWMGFQNRYNICIKEARKILQERTIGRLLNAEFEYGERLTTMHTYEDYRQTYMARSDMGGGPVLNLLVHDLDCIHWLLGKPVDVVSYSAKGSGLEIDVEDSVSALFTVKSEDGYSVPVYAHTDFLQFPPSHRIKIVGEKGRIEIDMISAAIRVIIDGEIVKEETYTDFVRNDMFIEELRDFFECIEQKKESLIGLDQGIVSLKMALAIKKSAVEHRFVELEDIK